MCSDRLAYATEDAAKIAATDRSKPPPMITNVMPSATIPTGVTCAIMSFTFAGARKPLYRMLATIANTISTQTIPSRSP